MSRFTAKTFLNLPRHTARIPPVDPAPATITAVFAIQTGHICFSSELLLSGIISLLVSVLDITWVFAAHEINLPGNGEVLGVTSMAGFDNQQRAGSTGLTSVGSL